MIGPHDFYGQDQRLVKRLYPAQNRANRTCFLTKRPGFFGAAQLK